MSAPCSISNAEVERSQDRGNRAPDAKEGHGHRRGVWRPGGDLRLATAAAATMYPRSINPIASRQLLRTSRLRDEEAIVHVTKIECRASTKGSALARREGGTPLVCSRDSDQPCARFG